MKNVKNSIPNYKKIAINIAHAICEGEYKEGDRLQTKTTLVGKYGVSTETARRAVTVLADAGVVVVKKNSGVVIISAEKAMEFLTHMKDLSKTLDITGTLNNQIKDNMKNMKEMQETFNDLLERISYYSKVSSIIPEDIKITEDCPYLGKDISAINFWQNTGATVVAIQHEGITCISPGPKCKLSMDDILFYVGEFHSKKKVQDFLYGTDDNQEE
jgi:K+/H+ antiporter YhaU regulatory subunit KhtT